MYIYVFMSPCMCMPIRSCICICGVDVLFVYHQQRAGATVHQSRFRAETRACGVEALSWALK